MGGGDSEEEEAEEERKERKEMRWIEREGVIVVFCYMDSTNVIRASGEQAESEFPKL